MATLRTMSSAAKTVIKNGLFTFASKIPPVNLNQPLIISTVPVRWGSFNRSPNMNERPIQTEIEIIDDPKIWSHVERLIARTTVPDPTPKDEYPSGWKPQSPNPNVPYFVQRSRNYMPSVYLKGNRLNLSRVTVIRRIRGDIWCLERELLEYLEEREGKVIDICVNEAFSSIYIRGDHVNNTIDFLEQKGL